MGGAFAPVSASSLGAFRALFGGVLVLLVVRFFAYGWIERFYVTPRFYFAYWGFEWLHPLPEAGMWAVFAAMGALALAVTLGWRSRASLAGFGVLFTYVELLDRTPYLNHYYLVWLLAWLLAAMPVDRALSLRRWWRARRGASLEPAVVPACTVWALRAQLALVYFFAGVAKLDPDWLFRAEPLRTWLAVHADAPVVGGLLATAGAAYALSWAGAAFDLLVGPALLWRRTRALAYAAVVVFHCATAWLFPIGIFPLLMVVVTTIFFEPTWPERVLAWTRARLGRRERRARRGPPRTPREPGVAPPLSIAGRTLIAVALGGYFAVQVLVPLRYTLYPGRVLWTEQGFRFAWQVMRMEKTGSVTFRVVSPSGAVRVVYPRDELTTFQRRQMSTQPDMILSYAHHLAREAGTGTAVYADAFASLNGRPTQRLVDPTIDLARQSEGFRPKGWIVPLATTPAARAERGGLASAQP